MMKFVLGTIVVLCWNMWWNQNMWHCFGFTKNNRREILLEDKFAFSGKTYDDYWKWISNVAFLCDFLSFVISPFLSNLVSTRWSPELDGRPVLWSGFGLCRCREEKWRPSSLCAIFSGLQVPGARQSLQVSPLMPLQSFLWVKSIADLLWLPYFCTIWIKMRRTLCNVSWRQESFHANACWPDMMNPSGLITTKGSMYSICQSNFPWVISQITNYDHLGFSFMV